MKTIVMMVFGLMLTGCATQRVATQSGVMVSKYPASAIGSWKRFDQRGSDLMRGKPQVIPALQPGETVISGATLRQRAKDLGVVTGQAYAELMMKNQKLLPTPTGPCKFVFPGTMWRMPQGVMVMPYLDWDGAQWQIKYAALNVPWGTGTYLIKVTPQ
ncbi:MAG: hypothetical protein KGI60_01420 [Patescibacteria group bacterium]|nr:hypothetical protein [Patescibacteria group bacterium]